MRDSSYKVTYFFWLCVHTRCLSICAPSFVAVIWCNWALRVIAFGAWNTPQTVEILATAFDVYQRQSSRSICVISKQSAIGYYLRCRLIYHSFVLFIPLFVYATRLCDYYCMTVEATLIGEQMSPENSHLLIFMRALLTDWVGVCQVKACHTEVTAASLCMSLNETLDPPISELLISYSPIYL